MLQIYFAIIKINLIRLKTNENIICKIQLRADYIFGSIVCILTNLIMA
jgi:hypothetical protein